MRPRKIRKEVIEFSKDMELQLRKNDHKCGWEHCSYSFLFNKLQEEVKELEHEIKYRRISDEAIIKEAADIANFCMMIADTARVIDKNWRMKQ